MLWYTTDLNRPPKAQFPLFLRQPYFLVTEDILIKQIKCELANLGILHWFHFEVCKGMKRFTAQFFTLEAKDDSQSHLAFLGSCFARSLFFLFT